MDLREPSTFSRVYAEHAPVVESIARRILGDTAQAQDVAHDVFLRLWIDPRGFDPARGDLGPYLRVLARSRALDAQRSRRARQRAGDRFQELAPPPAVAPAEPPHDRDAVLRALRKLPGPQREALVLSYWAGLRDHEVASHAGVPLGTAKSRIRLGLMRLREDDELELAG